MHSVAKSIWSTAQRSKRAEITSDGQPSSVPRRLSMRRDQAFLLDMLLAARDAVGFASGLTFSEFQRSRLHQHAVLKAVEIIGEAAARSSSEMREANSNIP